MRRRIPDLGHNPDTFGQIEGPGEFEFDIVGESFYQDALDQICGGKLPEGHDHECVAYLVPEPDNPHDANAVAVYIDNLKVGHVPSYATPRMAAALAGRTVTVDAMIIGGWTSDSGDGHYGVKLDL